ncbi:MAG TPA: ATP-binding protein, partial [Cytophagales bacterium]|nr:ATP-binding protein [Cytophagales bacterium]
KMFKRLHTHVEGSGVGLYIVKRILDNTGDRVEVDSKVGKGTIFKIIFGKDKFPSKDKDTRKKRA